MPKKYLNSKSIKLIATLILFLLLIFLNPRGIFGPVRTFFWTLSYPFQKSFYLVSERARSAYDLLASISSLKKENKNLIAENNLFSAEIALLKEEKRENDILREQLGLVPRDKFNLEASSVIGQDPQKLGSWLMIDKGSAQGIRENMPVIISDGILIGKIEEVYPYSSKVSLLTASSNAVNAIDLETGAKGVVKGEYGLGIMMDMVSQTDAINKGDTIATSGLGSDIPKGLLIGKAEEIKNSEDKLFQQALVVPRVKYSKLDIVFVIKNAK